MTSLDFLASLKSTLSPVLVWGSYPAVLFLFILWLFLGLRLLIKPDRSELQPGSTLWANLRTPLLLSVFAALVVVVSVPTEYRTLSDETNLLAVAQSMVQERAVKLITAGKWYYHNFQMTHWEIPTRPFLFPLLISFVHSVLGYSWKNGFVTNYILFALLILVLCLWVQQSVAKGRDALLWSLALVLLVLSQPVITTAATCAGFDLCFIVLLSFCFLLAKKLDAVDFSSTPAAPQFASFFIASALLLSQTRYEGPYFTAVLIICFLPRFKKIYPKKFSVDVGLLLVAAVVAVGLTIVQRILGHGLYQNAPGQEPFGITNLVNDTVELVQSLSLFRTDLPYAQIVEIFGLATAFIYIARALKNGSAFRQKLKTPLNLTLILSVVGYLLITLGWHFGRATHPSSVRFFIPWALGLSVLTYLGLKELLQTFDPSARSAVTALIVGLVAFLVHHPRAIDGRIFHTLTLNRETQHQYDFLLSQPHKNFLVVTDRPGQFVVNNWGAMDFNEFKSQREHIQTELKRHLFESVFIFQHVEYSPDVPSGIPTAAHDLGEAGLTRLKEIQITEKEFLRISRLEETP